MIIPDIVSVQPMTNRIGEVRYIQYVYGSDKGQTEAGTSFASPFRKPRSDVWYSSEVVEEEDIGDEGSEEYEGNLSWTPVRPGTVEINVGADTFKDDGNGNFPNLEPDSFIEYDTGKYKLVFDGETGDPVTASYEFNNERAPATVPQIDVRIQTSPVSARSRKLRALYAFDAA